MRTLRNNPGFYFDFPSMINEVLSSDFSKSNEKSFNPPVNIIKTEDSFEIEMVVPGFAKEEIKLNIENNKLVISSKVEDIKEEDTKQFSLKEFSKKSFSRTFTLPKNEINEDAIRANYTNGILSISLPKLETAKTKEPKLISIN